MIKYRTEKVIECQDWDNLIEKTYGRTYCFQQQNGCQPRQHIHIEVPAEQASEEYIKEYIPEEENGEEMKVKFKTWLKRDPAQLINNSTFSTALFWERNFYPDIDVLINDLYKKGLIEKGSYTINIDW